jgi:putative ABC transport system permease protein
VSKLFGVPMGTLTAVLLVLLALVLLGLAIMAARNRVFLRLGVRNVRRRTARSALIVAGLMLGTAIIAAALITGDTMSHTIRSSAIASLGQTDEVVSASAAKVTLPSEHAGSATGVRYFPQSYLARVQRAAAGSSLIDGVAPAIVEPVSVQDLTTRQNEPRVTLFATDPRKLSGFGTIRSTDGRAVSLAALRPGELYLNRKSAAELSARPGDLVRVFAGGRAAPMRVRAIVHYDGTGTDKSALLIGLPAAQQLLGRPGEIKQVLVSNRGGSTSGAALTNDVVRLLRPALAPLGLQADKAKHDALKTADSIGAAFMSFFTTFGSFSIAAGILLIFLIFVMLAAERRSELGIARAVGTRRGHLVQMFTFEGVSYALIAAAIGTVIGLLVAYGMVLLMASAFASTSSFSISYAVSANSVLVAYSIGVLLTFAVVGFSAWRVSRMNIVSAIRSLPEPPPQARGKRRWLPGLAGLLLGVLLVVSGVSSRNGITLGLGVSAVLLSLVPLARLAGAPDRAARTGAGLGLVLWFVLPTSRWLFGELSVDFSIFILSGLMIVIGATWAIMYNADLLLGALAWSLGRFRRLAPVLKMSMAYPLRSLFRTGVTLAMFTLVVFTLVVGATTTGSFLNGVNDLRSFGGGFDARATVAPISPIPDMQAALRRAPGVSPADFKVVSAQSLLPIKARQVGSSSGSKNYVVRGLDNAFLQHNTYALATRARGYRSDAQVWQAIRTHPGLAVIDAFAVPHRANFNFGALQEFKLKGFYAEDKSFAPVSVSVGDPQTGKRLSLQVIGVLSETAPQDMVGLMSSQRTLAGAFGNRVQPTSYWFAVRRGVNATAVANQLESAFVANGMQAEALSKTLSEAVSASLTFDRLIEGFMGLGLIVGVAALGVISARAVVERRQHIGVLRAIGFRREMVQLSFLLESSFIALTSIVVGTALGLAVAYNVIHDAARQPSWGNLSFDVPWATLAIIFVVVYLVALATTFAPAYRASRIYPAEALRYQ